MPHLVDIDNGVLKICEHTLRKFEVILSRDNITFIFIFSLGADVYAGCVSNLDGDVRTILKPQDFLIEAPNVRWLADGTAYICCLSNYFHSSTCNCVTLTT